MERHLQKFIASLTIIAVLAIVHAPAHAASVTTLAPGVLSDPNAAADGLGAGSADFNSPSSITPYGASSPAQGNFNQGIASFSGDGILMTNSGQDALGLYAEPAGDTTQYLTVRPFVGGSDGIAKETVTFGGNTYAALGLFWGSMDTYNSIQFYLGAALIDTVTGSAAAAAVVPPADATGDQVGSQNNRYVLIDSLLGGGLFDSIVLTSSQNSFELDNLAWGPGPQGSPNPAPLPAALPLFGAVLGGGLAIRKWRSKKAGSRA